MSKKVFRSDLDVLRASAVLFVLIYHFFPSYAPWGYAGVDVFIFISGYLIEDKLREGERLDEFFKNRIVRIYPPLLITLSFFLFVGAIVLTDSELMAISYESVVALFGLQNVHQASVSGYFDGGQIFRPYLHLWSLSIEMQFYALLGISFFLIAGMRKRITFLWSILLISFAIAVCQQSSSQYYSTFARIWEFVAGALLVYKGNVFSTRSRTFSLALAVIVFLSLTQQLNPGVDYPGVLTLLPILLCILVMIAEIDFSKFGKLFNSTVWYVARISYTLFLVHYPSLEFLKLIVGQPSVFQRVVVILFSFIFAYVVDLWIVKRVKILKDWKVVAAFSVILLLPASAISFYGVPISRPVQKINMSLLADSTNFELAEIQQCGYSSNVEERCRAVNASNSKVDILILGDSIAHALTPLFDQLLESDLSVSYKQIGAGSCPPFMETSNACNEFWEQALFDITTLYPDVPIVIAAQWPLYFDSSSKDERSRLAANYVEQLETLAKGRPWVIFVESPPLGARPKMCVKRLSWLYEDCSLDVHVADARAESVVPFYELVGKSESINVLSLPSLLCSSARCKVFENGKVLYLDDSHFSVAGARYLAELTRNFFSSFQSKKTTQ